MDAANRWETEAMRESRDRRSRRPAVSQDRDATPPGDEWRTLRDASDLTGIPIGTLRKWCRRATVDSYLESDGELTLRMVEMGSVRARSTALHGKDARRAASQDQVASRQSPVASPEQVSGRQSPDASQEEAEAEEEEEEEQDASVEPPATMIVPVDAWNKMLNQLGNLHEAGQQLAEARERAAKAETESLFLRERLAEMREEVASRQSPVASPEEVASRQTPVASPEEDAEVAASPADVDGESDEAGDAASAETVSFWRYVARGWKGRRR